jgi:hypothetical protein
VIAGHLFALLSWLHGKSVSVPAAQTVGAHQFLQPSIHRLRMNALRLQLHPNDS